MLAQRLIGIYTALTNAPYPRARPSAGRELADEFNNRAVSLLDLGRTDAAQAAWLAGLELDPYHPQCTYNHGLHAWRSGKMQDDELINKLGDCIDNALWPADVPQLLAQFHLERGDAQAALVTLDTIRGEALQREDVKTWDLTDGHCIRAFDSAHAVGVSAVWVSSAKRKVLSGGADHALQLWSLDRPQAQSHGHLAAPRHDADTQCEHGRLYPYLEPG